MAGARRLSLLVVESTADPASCAIADQVRARTRLEPTGATLGGEPVHRFPSGHHFVRLTSLHLHAEAFDIAARDAGLQPDAIVFLSKHKAVSGRPALTVHPVGNFGDARYGGQAGRLSPSAAGVQSELLRALQHQGALHRYEAEVTFEVTHHGPLLSTPACFLELGSSEAQWTDARGAAVVATALLDVLERPVPSYPIVVGLGGGHYGPRFTEAALTRAVHVGHMVPNHALDASDDLERLLANAVEATPGVSGVYAHRKMMRKEALAALRAAAESQGVPWLDSSGWAPLAAAVARPG